MRTFTRALLILSVCLAAIFGQNTSPSADQSLPAASQPLQWFKLCICQVFTGYDTPVYTDSSCTKVFNWAEMVQDWVSCSDSVPTGPNGQPFTPNPGYTIDPNTGACVQVTACYLQNCGTPASFKSQMSP